MSRSLIPSARVLMLLLFSCRCLSSFRQGYKLPCKRGHFSRSTFFYAEVIFLPSQWKVMKPMDIYGMLSSISYWSYLIFTYTYIIPKARRRGKGVKFKIHYISLPSAGRTQRAMSPDGCGSHSVFYTKQWYRERG